MKNLILFCGIMAFAMSTFAQTTGCLVTNGKNNTLYIQPINVSSPVIYNNIRCGGKVQNGLIGYDGPAITTSDNCPWDPGVIDSGTHTCFVKTGGYCGKIGTYKVLCPIDSYTIFLLLSIGFITFNILRKKQVLNIF